MQKVSFAFPPELVRALDSARGDLSRNQFVLGLLTRALREHEERELRRVTAEVYGDAEFARVEEALAEEYFSAAAESDL